MRTCAAVEQAALLADEATADVLAVELAGDTVGPAWPDQVEAALRAVWSWRR